MAIRTLSERPLKPTIRPPSIDKFKGVPSSTPNWKVLLVLVLNAKDRITVKTMEQCNRLHSLCTHLGNQVQPANTKSQCYYYILMWFFFFFFLEKLIELFQLNGTIVCWIFFFFEWQHDYTLSLLNHDKSVTCSKF